MSVMRRRHFLLAGVVGTLTITGACSGGGRDTPSTTLAAALVARRSVREYAEAALTADEVSALLWAAQGISSDEGLRTAPSAGALYPLTVRVALRGGLDRYQPRGHRLDRVAETDLRASLAEAAYGQEWLGRAPAVFAISGDVAVTARRYGARAERYVLMEAGHAAQNLLLQAVALGLGGTPVGAFDDGAVREVLGLSAGERPIYLLPVGRPRGA